jgi:hypothetical protein
MEDTETWREFVPIVGFQQYGVNRRGQVINLHTKQILKPRPVKGYIQYALYKVGSRKQHMRYGHRLVAEAFLPNPDRLPDINHKDEDGYNNWEDNLEWASKQYNSEYSLAKHYILIDPEGTEHKVFNLAKFCKENGLPQSTMARAVKHGIITRKGWSGYVREDETI